MARTIRSYDTGKILLCVSQTVNSSLDLDSVAELVLKQSISALKADHAALFLVDDETGRLYLEKAKGFTRDQSGNILILGSWEAINNEMIKTKRVVVANDICKDAIFKKKKLSISDGNFPVKSFLAVPLRKDGKILGSLIVSNKKRPGHVFSRKDIELLMALSNHIAIALSNARYFKEVNDLQAEAAQKEKMAVIGTLASGINHEIGNPLGMARNRCELFLLNAEEGMFSGKTPEEVMAKAGETMKAVIGNIDRTSAIAKKLLNFAKPSREEMEPVLVAEEIEEVLTLLSPSLNSQNVTIEKEVAGNISRIYVDRKQFQQILFNLIRNASQSMDRGGKVTIRAYSSGGDVCVDIEDRGPGIPKNVIKDLFKSFYTTKTQGKGTGLGLFIVRQLAEKNSGRAYLKSTVISHGSVFTVEFPEYTGDKQHDKKI